MYRWRVFKEQTKRRGIQVSINFDEYRSIVRTACWYCGGFTYQGYPGVDRVQNTGTYQKDNIVASCKICNFMKGPLSEKNLGQGQKHRKRAARFVRRLFEFRDSFTTRPSSLASTPYQSESEASVSQPVLFFQLTPSVAL